MRISASALFGSQGLRIKFRNQLPELKSLQRKPTLGDTPHELRRILKRVTQLRESLATFTRPIETRHKVTSTGGVGSPVSVQSATALELQTIPASAATMQSTEEINTTPTSFSPRGPEFAGSSTSTPTIRGTYDGSNGTNTLNFRVITTGLFGFNKEVEVRDNQNQVVDTLDVPNNSQASSFVLSNGLTVDFLSGSLETGDTFEVDVFDSIGSAPSPDHLFSGLRNDHPGLEEGFSITDGSFEVNGHTIDVYANDSINSVLSRISASSAGVTAVYDSDSEKIHLTQQTAGSSNSISLSNDTSGFLAAVKLDQAAVAAGSDELDERNAPLNQVSAFSSVQDGSFTINGVAISVDVALDSLSDVIARINASTEVDASLDGSSRFRLDGNDDETVIEVSADSTGLMSVLGIAQGVYEPSAGDVTQSKTRKGPRPSDTQRYAKALDEIALSINRMFADPDAGGYQGPFIRALREVIEESVMEQFDTDKKRIGLHSGIIFDFRPSAKNAFKFGDVQRLANSMRSKPKEFNELLYGNEDTSGLLQRMSDVARRAEGLLNDRLGDKGRIIDVLV